MSADLESFIRFALEDERTCQDPSVAPLFTSEDRADRARAERLCTGCPGQRNCAVLALRNGEQHWVFGGVDLSWRNGQERLRQYVEGGES